MENVYRVLNEFNNIFGQKPISIKPSMIDKCHIYLKMIYDEDVDISATHIKNDWNEFENCGKNCAMAKIWVTRDESTNKPAFILWYDNIYTNPYLMPDEQKADKFYDARGKLSGCLAGLICGKQQVTMSKRMLMSFIKMTMQEINSVKNHIFEERDIDKLQAYSKTLGFTIETLKILQEELESVNDM